MATTTIDTTHTAFPLFFDTSSSTCFCSIYDVAYTVFYYLAICFKNLSSCIHPIYRHKLLLHSYNFLDAKVSNLFFSHFDTKQAKQSLDPLLNQHNLVFNEEAMHRCPLGFCFGECLTFLSSYLKNKDKISSTSLFQHGANIDAIQLQLLYEHLIDLSSTKAAVSYFSSDRIELFSSIFKGTLTSAGDPWQQLALDYIQSDQSMNIREFLLSCITTVSWEDYSMIIAMDSIYYKAYPDDTKHSNIKLSAQQALMQWQQLPQPTSIDKLPLSEFIQQIPLDSDGAYLLCMGCHALTVLIEQGEYFLFDPNYGLTQSLSTQELQALCNPYLQQNTITIYSFPT
ncbi:MAG: hypothetical protein HY860_00730 [Chlamydiales bacterium]|nr:hypothetical protein [Chlamydiales bacterium]